MTSTAPVNMLYRYSVRIHRMDPCEKEELEKDDCYQAGDEVCVNLPNVQCEGQKRYSNQSSFRSDC